MNKPPLNELPDDVMTSPRETSGAPHDELPPTLPGFDLVAGLQRLQGNRALYIKLLGMFASGYSDIADGIEQAIDAGDWRQTHTLVHDLKGLAGNLSATDLFAAARRLDEAVKSNPTESEELLAECAVLRVALDEALASARSVVPPAYSGRT